MRFQVMQFIDVEDKIFGPFSWKQFIYLIGGAGIAAITFIINKIIFILIGIPLLGLSLLLAFYPFNGRSFSFFLESLFMYIKNKKIYFWRKDENQVMVKYMPEKDRNNINNFNETVVKVQANKINEISRKLDLNSMQKTEL